MVIGRPTVYSEETLEKTVDYLENYQSHGDVIPSIVGLARVLEVCRDTVHAWLRDEEKEDFSYIVRKLLSEQERALINGGLKGDMNANITKLVLGKHGYTEKRDQNNTGSVSIVIDKDDAATL